MREFGINIEDYECAEATAKDFFTKDNYIYIINAIIWYFNNCNSILLLKHSFTICKPRIWNEVGGQAVLGRQSPRATPWLTERQGNVPTLLFNLPIIGSHYFVTAIHINYITMILF